jgi:type I restriction-modification system DNA methylase subunit
VTTNRNREEVVNTQLAILISHLGVTADAETIHVHGKHRPDVLFELRGLRVVIEGKFADHPQADRVVLEDARNRVRSGIAHIAAAAIYPIELRTTPTIKILDVLARSQLRFRIIAETHESEGWFEGNPSDLMDALRRAQEALVKDNIVEQTAEALSDQLDGIAKLWMGQGGACDRLSGILGFVAPKKETPENASERRNMAAKVSALVLANAFIFQEQLAATDKRVTPLRRLDKEKDLVGKVLKHWVWIWKTINYVPIFQIGERILAELPISASSNLAVRALLSEAQNICAQQAALRHDLMGRIYHWLLHQAKYLGTYYTSVSAATLLLKLAFGLPWKQDFGDPAELANFKVADMACGTGTLLMAAAEAISDLYIRERAASGRTLTSADLQTLHRALMENILHGYDVLPSAVHLTASTLAMLAPEVAFVRMNLFVMPFGMDQGRPRLGSLDFLETSQIATQMALDYSQAEIRRHGASASYAASADVPKLDLCVMNPPFVRSVYGNLLFGSISEQRDELQKELSRRTKALGISATAGLGAPFVSLADRQVKPGGRIAFVLPVTLATGEAWSATRELIADRYHLEIVITSHEADRPNFSENTDLSEVLFIARRLRSKEQAGPTSYVNLWRNPRSIHESLDLANRIQAALAGVAGEVGETAMIRLGSTILGEVSTLTAPRSTENWTGALFAQSQLMQIYWLLNTKSAIRLPDDDKRHKLPLCRLDELGTLGYDARDIFDAFGVDKTRAEWSPYPGFWDHDSKKVRTIAQKPNASLLARTKPLPGRKLKSATAVWKKAGSILLVSRLRTNTHRVIATGFGKPVLGNTWWGFEDSDLSSKQRSALLLWLNGTLSILSYFGRRAITEGAWMQMKKPAWASMLVLDVRQLSKTDLASLAEAYEKLCEKELAPISQLDTDNVRQRIDDTLSEVLGLPDLGPIRELLAREPGLTAHDVAPRETVADAADAEEAPQTDSVSVRE